MKKFTQKDLDAIEKRGLKIEGTKKKETNTLISKIEIRSVGKDTIEFVLIELVNKGSIHKFEKEYKFHPVRKFRFDWAIPELKIAIEYEGLNSRKSRHTTKKGYTMDCEKYNLAVQLGWHVLRYTALNYEDFQAQIEVLISRVKNG